MTATTISVVYDNSTDAAFRSWASGVHNAILSLGWITASAAGQLNINTVTKPSASGHFPVYAVYQMNDALQTTSTSSSVYMRLEYGAGNAQTLPQIAFWVSPSIDSSGSLTGTSISNRRVIGGVQSPGALAYVSYFSGDINRVAVCMWQAQSSNGAGFFSVERGHNDDGTDNANIIYVVSGQAGNGTLQSQTLIVNPVAASPTAEVGFPCIFSTTLQSAPTHFELGFLFSAAVPLRGFFLNPSFCAGAYRTEDFYTAGNGGIFYITHYGAQQRWLALSSTASSFTVIQSSNARLCMRFD
jgi:hypothetical protein